MRTIRKRTREQQESDSNNDLSSLLNQDPGFITNGPFVTPVSNNVSISNSYSSASSSGSPGN